MQVVGYGQPAEHLKEFPSKWLKYWSRKEGEVIVKEREGLNCIVSGNGKRGLKDRHYRISHAITQPGTHGLQIKTGNGSNL